MKNNKDLFDPLEDSLNKSLKPFSYILIFTISLIIYKKFIK